MLALYLAYLDDDNDKALFEEIYLSYRKQMVALAMSILGNEDDAQDTVGDVFLHIAQRNWDVVREIENKNDLRNYLLKATKHASINKIKAKKKEPISFDTVNEFNTERREDLSDDSFLETICNRVEYQKVISAISSLSETYCDVLYYHFVLEMTAPQIAKTLNQTMSATKKQLVRGKKILLKQLNIERGMENGNQ